MRSLVSIFAAILILISLYQLSFTWFVNKHEKAIEEKDYQVSNTNIIKTQNIIMELMHTLDFEAGGEIANNLYQLYDYMYLKLVKANTSKDVESIKEVIKFLEDLRNTWAQLRW